MPAKYSGSQLNLLILIAITFRAGVCPASELRHHLLTSPRQSGPCSLKVLLPDHISPNINEKLRVLYLLPVEAGESTRWGNCFDEVVKLDLHNRHRLICVFPSFSDLPWYADHPSDQNRQQEAYFLRDVIPFVESNYPACSDAHSRLLVGFSKSGWGAWSLLLRNPDTFSRAAAFDAPMMMSEPGKYGSGPIFGSAENFQKYRITSLLSQRVEILKCGPARLSLFGKGNFESEHQQLIGLMRTSGIPLEVFSDRERSHSWNSGWLEEAVAWVARPVQAASSRTESAGRSR
jgi:S-formylglutathione hydrolase FrmB